MWLCLILLNFPCQLILNFFSQAWIHLFFDFARLKKYRNADTIEWPEKQQNQEETLPTTFSIHQNNSACTLNNKANWRLKTWEINGYTGKRFD